MYVFHFFILKFIRPFVAIINASFHPVKGATTSFTHFFFTSIITIIIVTIISTRLHENESFFLFCNRYKKIGLIMLALST